MTSFLCWIPVLLLALTSSAVAQYTISIDVCVPRSGDFGRAEGSLLNEIRNGNESRLRIFEYPAEHAANVALNCLYAMTAVIVYDMSDEPCIRQAATFVREFTRGGGRIVLHSKVRTGDRDFMGQISQVRRTKPDVIYAPLHSLECALLARQTLDMGVNVTVIAGEAVRVQELIEFGGRPIVLTTVRAGSLVPLTAGPKE